MPQNYMASGKTDFSCVVINFNGSDVLQTTLESLYRLTRPPVEIILVDDGSTDGSLELVVEKFPDVIIEKLPSNTGRTALVRNAGLRRASQRFVLVTDNDIRFDEDAVSELMGVLRSNPDAAASTPIVLFDDTSDEVFVAGHDIHYLCWSNEPELKTLAELRSAGPTISAGCGIGLFDMERLKGVGLFDENLIIGWGDDGEFHHRMRIFGRACYRVPTALVYHQRIRSYQRIKGTIHNRLVFLLSNYQSKTLILLAPALILFESLLVVYTLASGNLSSYVEGWRCFWARRGEVRQNRLARQSSRRQDDKDILVKGRLDLRFKSQNLVLEKGLDILNGFFKVYWSAVRAIL